MPETLTHKEMTAHIRRRLRTSGIKALCRMGSFGSIIVQPVTSDGAFTDEEQGTILLVADANRLTLTRGMEIVLEQRTYGRIAYFEYDPYRKN